MAAMFKKAAMDYLLNKLMEVRAFATGNGTGRCHLRAVGQAITDAKPDAKRGGMTLTTEPDVPTSGSAAASS